MKRLVLIALLGALIVGWLSVPPVEAQKGGVAKDSAGILSGSGSLNTAFTFNLNGGYIAAGDGIRGSGSGSITISGIPSGATVVKALLYWEVLGFIPRAKGVFNGYPIRGQIIGRDVDPCWGLRKITCFRADVTDFVPGNGTYTLSDFPDSGDFGVAPSTEGASLVVVYGDSASPLRTIIINDGCATIGSSGASVTTSLGGFTASASPAAQITYIVGDGQFFSVNEEFTLFNSTTIATDNFDGSDGELWDTDTFNVSSLVSSGDTSATAGIRIEVDCLTWGAAVFAVSSTGGPEFIEAINAAPALSSQHKLTTTWGAIKKR
ncbi:DUF3344 domain-containing protein [Candidatus Poribacteria bacterium]|nr:DUF3344 domain-containing protein [Candidatus Poribacteria bacterium]